MGILDSTGFSISPSAFAKTLDLYLDLHRTYLFRVMFFDGNILDIAAGAATTNLISSTATPVSRTEAIKLGWYSSNVKVPGKTEVQDWKVTLRDDAINTSYTYMQNWRDQVYNFKTGKSKPMEGGLLTAGFKKSAIIIMLGNMMAQHQGVITPLATTTRAYLLHGIWPMEIGEITLDYSAEGIALLPVTFSMDRFEPYSLMSAVASIF